MRVSIHRGQLTWSMTLVISIVLLLNIFQPFNIVSSTEIVDISDSTSVWSDDLDDSSGIDHYDNLRIENGEASLLNIGFDPLAWDKKGVAVPNGTATDIDCKWTMQPFVLKDDGIYKMWYTGYRNPHPDYTYSIMYATSTDAENWTKQGVAFGPDSVTMKNNMRGIAVPCVLKDDDGYKMYYSGQDADTNYFEMYMATSDDGLNWIDQGKILGNGPYGTTDFMGLENGKVIKMPDGTYKMVYVGYDGVTKKLHMATSSDGVNWQKEGMFLNTSGPGSPDFMWLTEPFMVYHNDTFLLWYSGYPYYGQTVICFATSTDGNNWTKHGEVLSPSLVTDSRRLGGPNVMIDDGGLVRLWYYGFNTSHLVHYAETDYLSEFYISQGEIITKPIQIPENKAWVSLNISKSGIDTDNTISVSIRDADSGSIIESFADLEGDDIDISNISCLDHPNLQLVAQFKSNSLRSPVLHSWELVMSDDAMEYVTILTKCGEPVTFNCADSFDDSNIVNCTWTFEYNRTSTTLYGHSCCFHFWTPGNYSVILKTINSNGVEKSTKVLVDISENGVHSDGIMDYIWIFALMGVLILLAVLLIFRSREKSSTYSGEPEIPGPEELPIDIMLRVDHRYSKGEISEDTYLKLKEKYGKGK